LKVLVCGSRYYADGEKVFRELDALHNLHHFTLLIEGGATGADSHARAWAKERDVRHHTYWADWRQYGLAAGPIRNQRMLEAGKPELVVAFPGGVGTADMVARARKAGVTVLEIAP
jgi:YspA, cpYpsA-related SLOG family